MAWILWESVNVSVSCVYMTLVSVWSVFADLALNPPAVSVVKVRMCSGASLAHIL